MQTRLEELSIAPEYTMMLQQLIHIFETTDMLTIPQIDDPIDFLVVQHLAIYLLQIIGLSDDDILQLVTDCANLGVANLKSRSDLKRPLLTP